eukprot:403331412
MSDLQNNQGGIGTAQTLQQRKAQQKKQGNQPNSQTRAGGSLAYYTTADIPKLIKEELGFNQEYLFKDYEEEMELKDTKKGFEIDVLLEERFQKVQKLEERLKFQLDEQKNQFSQQFLLENQRVPGKRRFRDDSEGSRESKDSNFDSSSDSDRSGQSSSEDNYENPERGATDKNRRQEKMDRKTAGYQKDQFSSDSDIEVTHKGAPSRFSRDQKQKTQQDQQISIVQEVYQLDQLKKIILKRAKLEQWVEYTYFKEIVVGCFVRFSFSGRYRLAEIVEVKENPGNEYELGKFKTSLQLGLRFSNTVRFFKLILVSNADPNEDEFREMLKVRQECKHKPITIEQVQLKAKEIKRYEDMTNKPEEVENMVSIKFKKRMQEGKLAGLNLSFVKVELANNIGLFKRKLQDEDVQKNPTLYLDIQNHIAVLERDLIKVEQANVEENLKRGNFLKTGEQGQERYQNIEMLEKIKEAEDWVKYQDYMTENPTSKKPTFFMKMNRQDSTQLTESEKQKRKIQKELQMIRQRSQATFEENKKETYFQQMERMKREQSIMNNNITFDFEKNFTIQESIDGKKTVAGLDYETKPAIEEIKPTSAHPNWLEYFNQKCYQESQQVSQHAKIISFDEYFQQ